MDSAISKPLIFHPLYKDYLWGGNSIPVRYNRTGAPDPCAESWEISAYPGFPSIIANGSYKGEDLRALTKRFGRDLVGTRAPDANHFSLLFKIIDTRIPLSVQVHPNQNNAWKTGGHPKTEAWVILNTDPGAKLYAGFKEGTDEHSLREAIDHGTVEDLLAVLHPQLDDGLLIPGGLIHSIGGGCLLYEVQRNSDTTYRLFDWNRIENREHPRVLHIEECLKAIDWSLKAPQTCRPVPIVQHTHPGVQWFGIIQCEFFTTRKLLLSSTYTHKLDHTTFYVFFVVKGQATLSSGGESVELATGSSVLVPAAAEEWTLDPAGPLTEFIVTTY